MAQDVSGRVSTTHKAVQDLKRRLVIALRQSVAGDRRSSDRLPCEVPVTVHDRGQVTAGHHARPVPGRHAAFAERFAGGEGRRQRFRHASRRGRTALPGRRDQHARIASVLQAFRRRSDRPARRLLSGNACRRGKLHQACAGYGRENVGSLGGMPEARRNRGRGVLLDQTDDDRRNRAPAVHGAVHDLARPGPAPDPGTGSRESTPASSSASPST